MLALYDFKALEMEKSTIRKTYSYDLKALFTNAFGIIKQDAEKPQVVQLMFNYEQECSLPTFVTFPVFKTV